MVGSHKKQKRKSQSVENNGRRESTVMSSIQSLEKGMKHKSSKKKKKGATKDMARRPATDETAACSSSTSLLESIFGSGQSPASPSAAIDASAPSPPLAFSSLFRSKPDDDITASKPDSVPPLKQPPRPPSKALGKGQDPKRSNKLPCTESRDAILRRRRQQSKHPLLVSDLDFPTAFATESGQDLPPEEKISEMAQAVRHHGVCVIRQAVDATVLQDVVIPIALNKQRSICQALDRHGIPWQIQQDSAGSDHGEEEYEAKTPSSTTFRFKEAASRCKGRMDVVLEPSFVTADGFASDFFQGQIFKNSSTIIQVVQSLFGGEEQVRLVYSGLIFNWPGSSTQPWHQDGEPLFPESPHSAQMQASLPPYALNVFIPLESSDGEVERGPTEFLPGSHLWSSIEELDQVNHMTHLGDNYNGNRDSNNDLLPPIVAPILRQGDALIYDYRVCHRGTSNVCALSTHRPRRILYLMFARPWFQDHVNFDYTKSAESLWR